MDTRSNESFRQGTLLLAEGKPRDALGFLKAAVEMALDEEMPDDRRALFLSYYGLCLCQTRQGFRDALIHCRAAAALHQGHPDVWWNLGRVAGSLGRTGEAFRALQRGIELHPRHVGLHHERQRLGVRKRPVLPFLHRRNPVNVALGKFRSRSNQTPSPSTALAS